MCLLRVCIAVKAQMKLRVRKYSRGCRVMVPRTKKIFLDPWWCVLGTNSVNVFTKISLDLHDFSSFQIKESESEIKKTVKCMHLFI